MRKILHLCIFVCWVTSLLLVSGASLADEPAKQDAPVAEFRYPMTAEHLVLDYQLRSGLIYYGEPRFGLKLYGDGRAISMLPEKFPKNAIRNRGYSINRRGYFEIRLSPREVEEILVDLEPMLLIDTDATRSERKAQRSGGGRTDGAFTHISIHLADYRPADGDWQGAIAQSVEWQDLFGDARRYPDIPGIQALRRVDEKLPHWVFRLASRVEAAEKRR